MYCLHSLEARNTALSGFVAPRFRATVSYSTDNLEGGIMLYWMIVFLVVAVIAGVLGFAGVAVAAASVAKLLFVIFLALFLISLIGHLSRRGSGV
jgi:uncharacterized membrane protein YtjA (UPF0391 family)